MYSYEKVNMIILKTRECFQNININLVFQLNIFYFICKIELNIYTVLVADFMSLYTRRQVYMHRYEKVVMIFFLNSWLFSNININVIFLLIFLFYMQNTVKNFHRTHCRFYVFIFADFSLPIWESRYDNILNTHDYFQNIKIHCFY